MDTDPVTLHLVHIPDGERDEDGKRKGKVTRENVTLEDMMNALVDLQITQQVIESRNGTGLVRRYVFEVVMEKSKEMRRLTQLFHERVFDIYDKWPDWYHR